MREAEEMTKKVRARDWKKWTWIRDEIVPPITILITVSKPKTFLI